MLSPQLRHERYGIHTQEGPLCQPSVVLADQKLACVLPETHDLPLLVPITALSALRVQNNILVD